MTTFVMFSVDTPSWILINYKCIRSKYAAPIYYSTDYTGSKYTACYVAFDVPEDEVIVLMLQGHIIRRVDKYDIHGFLQMQLSQCWRWRDFQ